MHADDKAQGREATTQTKLPRLLGSSEFDRIVLSFDLPLSRCSRFAIMSKMGSIAMETM